MKRRWSAGSRPPMKAATYYTGPSRTSAAGATMWIIMPASESTFTTCAEPPPCSTEAAQPPPPGRHRHLPP